MVTESASITLRDATIRLVGPPDRLLGVVCLDNPSAAQARIKAFEITQMEPVLAGRLRRCRLYPSRLLLPAHGSCNVGVETSFDDLAPPGKYKLKVRIGDREYPCEAEVKPQPMVEIQPDTLQLQGAPGERVIQELIIDNQGNVPVEIGMLGVSVLTEIEQICTSLQTALQETHKALQEKAEAGYETFLNAMVNRLASKKVDLLRAKAKTKTIVAPGEVEAVPIEFHIPADVHIGHTYRGKLRAFDRVLRIQLSANGGKGAEKPKGPRRKDESRKAQ